VDEKKESDSDDESVDERTYKVLLTAVEDIITTEIVPIAVSEPQCNLICVATQTVDPITCSCVPITDETTIPEHSTEDALIDAEAD
jgi:hypothetical protein